VKRKKRKEKIYVCMEKKKYRMKEKKGKKEEWQERYEVDESSET
jgi:hypothetical protein